MRGQAKIFFLGLVVLLGACGLYFASSYNRLIRLQEQVPAAWSQVENVLQRRNDLIPNLVSTVKGSSNFETSTLEKVVEARAKAMGAGTMEEHKEGENMLTGALKSILHLQKVTRI